MFSNEDTEPGFDLYLFNDKLASYQHMTDHEKERFRILVKKNQVEKANKVIRRYTDRTVTQTGRQELLAVGIEPRFMNLPISEIIPAASRSHIDNEVAKVYAPNEIETRIIEVSNVFAYAFQLAAGLCLYLQTIPAGSNLVSEWSNVKITEGQKVKPGQGITDEAKVCRVSTHFSLSWQEVDIFRQACSSGFKGVVSPHFRRGYWSRPVGLGQDPSATKTVWHRPTIVNLHLLKEGGLPHGANVITN